MVIGKQMQFLVRALTWRKRYCTQSTAEWTKAEDSGWPENGSVDG